MVSWGSILCRRILLAAIIFCVVEGEVFAAFGGLVPLSWSGQLSYNYGYVDREGGETESTSLLLGLSASGYVWHPWFATTSLALNVGLSNTQSSTSSSDSTVGSGSVSVSVFPRSRFPFSASYTRTDSKSESFNDASLLSADTDYHVTRLSLRQSYRPRAYNQMYNAWYNSTQFEGDFFGSESTVYGLDYSLRVSKQTLTVNMSHSETSTDASDDKPSLDLVTVGHVYTPSAELGVNSLVSYVENDPSGGRAISQDTQAFSAFYWRPEHRAVNVTGGVRLTESSSDEEGAPTSRALNTNLGLGYQVTRSLSFGANASVGTSDSGDTQTLTTSQSLTANYTGDQRQFSGYTHTWQWGGSMSNSTSRTEVLGDTTSADQQSIAMGLGHGLGKSWTVGRGSSMNGGFSQAVSGSKSSESDEVTSTLNHGVNLSWNKRGRQGTIYASGRVGDSRAYGEKDTVYDDFSANLASDYTINRLSSLSGNMNFSANQSETEDADGEKITSGSRILSGGVSYRNDRPLGIYNLQFSSLLSGSKQIDSSVPTATWRWEGLFRYNLGLLSTTLALRVTESAGGSLTKSMNFQATRRF